MKPMIAISARGQLNDPKRPHTRFFFDNESYFRYVEKGGGFPVMLSVVDAEAAEEAAQRFDGLLITGGGDVDPSFYGEENTLSEPVDHDIDLADDLLYHAFRKAGKPILGICRGIQTIAVSEGGTLVQDIPSVYGVQHNQSRMDPPLENYLPAHEDTFVPGTRMHAIFGDIYGVNTFHHQCIRTVPEGFTVSAYSPEGIIEAIEKEHVTAVQWHPERMSLDPKHMEIMIRFVQEAAEAAASAR